MGNVLIDLYRKIEDKILNFVFDQNDRPLSFVELLKANKIYDDHMPPQGQIPGIRLNLIKTFVIFVLLWHIVIIPIIAATHGILKDVDCHISILLAILFTLLFFGTFAIFKEWLYEKMLLKKIKENWENHFPLLSYENNHLAVTEIYTQALEKEIPANRLRSFIFDNLAKR
ncbi:MAG: hypothetical protein GXO31_08790 [Epsilonproteobacteria bacterium]|nr:hypothetical protein [Campylobacterota bacterium]